MPPFAESTRREIFKRDEGTCQNDNCICRQIYGSNATWRNGFMLNAAHYPEQHQKAVDYDQSHGRMECVTAHIIEEIQRGNHKGAQLLYESQTIRNTYWLREHDFQDEKMPMNWYYDVAHYQQVNDQLAVEGLILAYQERFGIVGSHQYDGELFE